MDTEASRIDHPITIGGRSNIYASSQEQASEAAILAPHSQTQENSVPSSSSSLAPLSQGHNFVEEIDDPCCSLPSRTRSPASQIASQDGQESSSSFVEDTPPVRDQTSNAIPTTSTDEMVVALATFDEQTSPQKSRNERIKRFSSARCVPNVSLLSSLSISTPNDGTETIATA